MALTRREIAARYRARHLEKELARGRACSKRHHAAHRDEAIAAMKARYKANREEISTQRKAQWLVRTDADRVKDKERRVKSRDRDNERRRLKRAENPEAARRRDHEYRAERPEYRERAVARTAKWMREHPEWWRALQRKGDAKRRAIEKEVFIENVDPRVVFERDFGICGICHDRVDPMSKWEVDHIVPISKYGTHCYANVQLAHRKCNRSKAARLVA